jgi:DNA invertase Pin-like site-specific DNA recombinase
MKSTTAALYLRVSKTDESQDPDNQCLPLVKMAESLEVEVVKEYVDLASGGSTTRPKFQQVLKDAQRHEFDMILVWSLDRSSREGISRTLSYLEQLKRSHVGLRSLQESWLDTSDEGMGQLLISIFSWVAQQERKRIAERTKAGLAKAKANGKTLGCPKGSKDKKPRRKVGYVLRWSA